MDDQIRFPTLFGKIFGILGLAFFIPGVTFLCLSLNAFGDDALAFTIIGATFSFIGGVFAIIGGCSFFVARKQKAKRERLMRDGVCYDGDIVRVYDNLSMRINYRHPLVVECVYKDKQNETYLVKSKNIWLNSLMKQEKDLKARVWVNYDDSRDYWVEVYTDTVKNDMKIDHDYR